MFNYIDIIIIAIVILSVIIGIWRGFIRSLTHFCGFFVKLIASFFLAKPIANLLYNKTPLGEQMFEKYSAWASGLNENFNINLKTIPSEELTDFIKNTLGDGGVPKIFRGLLTNVLNITPQSLEGVESITLAQLVGQSLTNLILIVCCFIAIFILLTIIIFILNHLEKKLLKSTRILSKIDRGLGGIVGLLSAVELIFSIFLVLSIFRNSALFSGLNDAINNSLIGSPLSKFMYGIIDKNFDLSQMLNDWLNNKTT